MSKAKDKRASELFRAMGHPVRIQIIQLLQERGALFAGELSRRLPVAASTASQHLKLLKEAGLISDAIDGPHRIYSIRKEALLEAKNWMKAI
jgi:DNA-binding transcriptional ArsR family regulator